PDSFRVAAQMVGKHNPVITSDGGWLRTKAEIEILNGTPETAITTLLPALEAHPNSTPLTFDFAIAFFQRAVRTGSREDLDRSIGLLSNLVKRDPANREALFNLAIAYGQREAWTEAIATWEAYLMLDPEGPWAREAREKRDLAKSKLR